MNKKVLVFLVDGFEEIEALAPIDLLRRAGVEVVTVSIKEEKAVMSSRNVKVFTDEILKNIKFDEYDMIVLPGGPGYINYNNSTILLEKIKQFVQNKKIAAICAAPVILANLGILNGVESVCFPACVDELKEKGAIVLENEKVITRGNITTSKSAGTAIDFALELINVLCGEETSLKIKNQIIY